MGIRRVFEADGRTKAKAESSLIHGRNKIGVLCPD